MARKIILVFSGFTEHNHENTGSKELYEKLLPYSAMGAHGNEVLIALKEWNYDWKAFANFLNSMDVEEAFVSSYSWGAGYGLREFAKYFKGNIHAVLCDPVYRSVTPLFRWFALLDWTVKYPKNVQVVDWFNQHEGEPGGDKVKSPNPLPKVKTLPYTHSEIDNSKEYHESVEKHIKDWLSNG